ncbi:hypothetical protein COEREDRAFT_88710 [Coemansia reversa NRRL 1564]|uniref:Yeast cell wall synthesis Kre9/Knh1-like N-terminal domain-containing protein n=1 Tax=Coemansia reversa (strain ATCC 12441 / NRRL 1564) TaxID=763665 RepID=A0A2G5B654_COERN|nr:hypothetical protein COEREDRAFT_88710 [Coemansia reversa NRRL 1564]|eukprot:PIA14472.1 hypothetical protein COEREDRAFT_88710 [Coemansia reversa NRRL 1564]
MKLLSTYLFWFLAATALAKLQITLPNPHTEWQPGNMETIRWRTVGGNLKGKMSIELMEGSDPSNLNYVTTIAENVPENSSQASWAVPKNLKKSSNYAIRVVDENGEDFYGQSFKISDNKANAIDARKKADSNKLAAKSDKESQTVKLASAESSKHAESQAHSDHPAVSNPKNAATPIESATVESNTSNAKSMRKESEPSNAAISRLFGGTAAVVAACAGVLGAAAF